MDTKSQEHSEKARRIRYRETYDNDGWWWLVWFGFFLAWRSCAGIILSLLFVNTGVYSLGYSIGTLISFGFFLIIAIYGSKNSPEGVSTFFIVLYVLGALANLCINPFVLIFYFLFLIPMYKVSQGRLYDECLVKNDDEHGLRYKSYRCDPEVEETDRCLIYNNRHIDKDKLLQGEIEYLSKLPKERLKVGYERVKKNRKLKKHAPVFRKILLEAYDCALFPEKDCKDDEFSWFDVVEATEKKPKSVRNERLTENTPESESWLSLIDAAENNQEQEFTQKGKEAKHSKENVKYILAGAVIIICVVVAGVAGAFAFTRMISGGSTATIAAVESDTEKAEEIETSETTDSAKSNRLTAEDQEEIAAGVAARKAEKERRKAASDSSNSAETAVTTEGSSTAEQTMPAEEETASSESGQATATVADNYLEDTYNNYAAQIQSESASLVGQLQAGTIDYMTASQQLSNLYSTGNQAMSNYWMNGNCSYADMTTWSNKLWSVYTTESPKLVGVGQ